MRLKILHVDLGGCEGCCVSVLRAFPQIENFTYLEMKYLKNKYKKNNDYDIIFISGGVCMNEPSVINKLKELREKCKILVAFGSCSSLGGILRFCKGGQSPRPDHRNFQPINSVVEVDYSIPGCPPPPQMVVSFVRFFKEDKKERLKIFKSIANFKKLSGFDLIDDIVLRGLCIGCGVCELSCPTNAIRLIGKQPDLVVEKCIRCGTCYVRCPKASQLICKEVV